MLNTEMHVLRAWFTAAITHAKAQRNERGDIAQTVILIAIFAAAALAIGAIIVTKFTDKARSIPTS